MARPESAVIRAQQHLQALARQARASGNPILPSLSRLARQCGVSRPTVLKAIQRMQHAGLIVSVPYRGYAAVGPTPSDPPEPSPPQPQPPVLPQPRWQSLAQNLERDILEGRFAAGTLLPSAKELCTLYGCGHRSLLRALRSLCEQGRLRHHGLRYQVGGAMPNRPFATVVFVGLHEKRSLFTSLTPHAGELWRNLEHKCLRRRLALRTHTHEAMAARPQGEDATTVGYIVSTVTYDHALLIRAIRAALATHLPVVLLDEGFNCDAILRECAHPLLRCFALGTRSDCGRQVGEYLLSRGHRRVVFLAGHDSDKERLRWAGVCRPFEQVGRNDAVEFRSLELVPWTAMRQSPEVMALRVRLEEMARRFARSHDAFTPQPDLDPLILTMAHSLMAPNRTRSLFDETLRTRTATAWVAYNDDLALLALRHLRAAGVQLPQQLSLIGFDDTLEGFGRNLSSYSFNIPAIVSAILEHLLAPKRAVARNRVVEIPGMVLERGTSGKRSADCRA